MATPKDLSKVELRRWAEKLVEDLECGIADSKAGRPETLERAIGAISSRARTPAEQLRSQSPPSDWLVQRSRVLGLLIAAELLDESTATGAWRRSNLSSGNVKERELGDWLQARYTEAIPRTWPYRNPFGDTPRRTVLGRPRPEAVSFDCAFPRSTGRSVIRLYVPPNGPLAKLAEVAEARSVEVGLSSADVALVVLTGKPVGPIAVRSRIERSAGPAHAARILLEVDPMMTPAEVGQAFDVARGNHFGAAPGSQRGRGRPFGLRTLELIEFAARHPEMGNAELCRRWNEVNPDAPFAADAFWKQTQKADELFLSSKRRAVLASRRRARR